MTFCTIHQMYAVCQQKDEVELIELNVQADYVYLAVSIAPKYALCFYELFLFVLLHPHIHHPRRCC